jgi:integrase
VRSIVNALRSLYRWAQDRELVANDPAARVRLPAMNATPRDRVATPAEFTTLLAALEIEDALPYALAAYAMGRRAQIQRLRWGEVDVRIGAIEWGVDEEARKSPAARRVVPTVKPLLTLLKRAWIRQGRPAGQALVCPPRRRTPNGLLHTEGLAARAKARWREEGLLAIGLHECRHTAATWLDAAGVSPKVASVLMGHAAPDHQPGAASITLARYTHTLPDTIETARKQLDVWLEQQLSAAALSSEPRDR